MTKDPLGIQLFRQLEKKLRRESIQGIGSKKNSQIAGELCSTLYIKENFKKFFIF